MTVNLAAARAFLEALGGQGPFTFQTLPDRKGDDPSLNQILHGSLEGCARKLEQLNARGAGVFVTVNQTDGHGRTAANVTGLRALFVDKDDGVLDEAPGANVRVRTARGEHAYWLLSPEESRTEFGAAQKRLIAALGTDPSIHDLPRIMRLPGFFHMKGEPFMVECWIDEDEPHRTIAEVMALFPALEAAQSRADRTQKATRPTLTGSARLDKPIAELALARDNRNDRLTRVSLFAGDLVFAGEISEDEAWDRLWEACEKNSLAAEEPDKSRSTIARALSKDRVDMRLRVTAKGTPVGDIANVLHVLATHALWQGVLGFNERRECPEIVAPPPWDEEIAGLEPLPRRVTAADGARLSAWLAWRYHMIAPSHICREALGVIAEQSPFDRVRDYLESLPEWDGVPRIAEWLIRYAGADDTRYVRAVSGRWLISAVARALIPGCKVDTMLILEGPQGIKKSTLLRVLAGDEFFSDQMPPVDSKDAKIHVHGPWIAELPELGALAGRRGEAVKAFLSMREDTFRRPYGAGETTSLRRIVFAGTSNVEEFLDDPTGARRFWPVACRGAIDVAGVAEVRDQLWTEALHLYRCREAWWLTDEEVSLAAEVQEEAYEADALEDVIANALENGATSFTLGAGKGIVAGCDEVTVADILDCVCGDSRERKTVLQKRVAKALRHLGWTPFQESKGRRAWRKGRFS